MSLKTFDVPWTEGRTRFVNYEGNKVRVTVECFHRKVAFSFLYDKGPVLSSGRWIRFCGNVRMDTSIKSDGTLADKNLFYIHDPADGSNRLEWLYFPLINVEFKILGPKETVDSIRETINLMRRQMDSWSHNCRIDSLNQLIESMESTLKILTSFRSEMLIADSEPIISHLDITV